MIRIRIQPFFLYGSGSREMIRIPRIRIRHTAAQHISATAATRTNFSPKLPSVQHRYSHTQIRPIQEWQCLLYLHVSCMDGEGQVRHVELVSGYYGHQPLQGLQIGYIIPNTMVHHHHQPSSVFQYLNDTGTFLSVRLPLFISYYQNPSIIQSQ